MSKEKACLYVAWSLHIFLNETVHVFVNFKKTFFFLIKHINIIVKLFVSFLKILNLNFVLGEESVESFERSSEAPSFGERILGSQTRRRNATQHASSHQSTN